MNHAINVMIVDDSAVVRQTLSTLLSEEKDINVVATAPDPIIATNKLRSIVPDVVILDIEMPRMDGLTFLKTIMTQHPLPVIICSSKTEEGSQNALNALDYGAVDIIQKPKIGTKQFLQESKVRICDVVRAASLTTVSQVKSKPKSKKINSTAKIPPKLTADAMMAKPRNNLAIDTTEKIVALGASTGGTEAIRIFLESLPVDAPGIVIVQHMPEHFTAAFAKRLDSICRVTVREAVNGDSVLRGTALIAPGNKHMLLKRSGARYYVEVKDGPLVCRHRPSVDVLFRSTARYAGQNAVGIILTGMGDDGSRGMEEMKAALSYNIAQDEKSCVVFGMPNEAIKRNCIDIVLPLDKIAAKVMDLIKN